MQQRSVLLVSHHFYPSNAVGAKRPSETALHLSRAGYDVCVLCARDPDADAPRPSELGDLQISAVTVPPRWLSALWLLVRPYLLHRRVPPHDAGGVQEEPQEPAPASRSAVSWPRRQVRAFDALLQANKRLLFKNMVRLWLLCRRRKFDLVIASGPPVIGYVSGAVASKLSGAPLLLDFRDPWYLHVDSERVRRYPDHPFGRLEDFIARLCIRASTRIIVASPGIRKHILTTFDVSGKPVDVVRNGFDPESRISAPVPSGSLEMLYAGSLYWNRNPFPFLTALRNVAMRPEIDRSKIRFRLVGQCSAWEGVALAPWLRERQLEDIVETLPPVGRSELTALVERSNVLVNFAQGQAGQIPAKSFEYLASGRDIVSVTETTSDVAHLFREAGVGEIVPPDDSARMEQCIAGMYERHVVDCRQATAPPANLDSYARQAQLEIMERIVRETVSARGS